MAPAGRQLSARARGAVVGGGLACMAGIALGAEGALHLFGQNVAAFEWSVVLCAIVGVVIGVGLGLALHAIDPSSGGSRHENVDHGAGAHQPLKR